MNKQNNDTKKINNLAHYIKNHDFEKALDILCLSDLDEKNIKTVIDYLIKCGESEILEFSIYLYTVERKMLVSKYFPEIFTKLFSNQPVRIKNKYYNSLQLKLGTEPDSDGDRSAYGSDPSFPVSLPFPDRFLWIIKFAIDSNGRNYFRIENKYYSSLQLKLGTKSDSDGDHSVYGSNPSSSVSLPLPDRFLWQLKIDSTDIGPDGSERTYFRIENKHYSSLQLKLGTKSDSDGDHSVYGSDPSFSVSLPLPDRFLWSLE
ncbi:MULTISPECIES: hypothetical protein [Photorhabdus]|uniref:hypothetical protein n=1 Tax=Photorhabdus TaxID=29487 RepID=UPI000DCE1FEF|nr:MULTISPECIES: hypothetical protein [Photorhabdus]AXG45011.1 hypothetical protein PluDJC_24060 [Photorhabdus laumondii subsp. laumondii]NDL15757.1 hypothetical protein [Photorhabdus laumondii subsp. laumondii]NDL47522.1 hypothetical protein [Photorhabdus laumondii subsp. laumondii]NDL53478.1 hypothetical protein [Photorhabdus laumondii subsp. laumondii]RAW87065.1 hypothetical protein CKY09_06285 [Photorhabdus sp. S5P8-50]